MDPLNKMKPIEMVISNDKFPVKSIPDNKLFVGQWLFSPKQDARADDFNWLVYIEDKVGSHCQIVEYRFDRKGPKQKRERTSETFKAFLTSVNFYELLEEEAILMILQNGPFRDEN